MARRTLGAPAPAEDRLWSPQDVCGYLAVSLPKLKVMLAAGGFPAPIKVGRSNRWRPAVVRGWVEAHERAAGKR